MTGKSVWGGGCAGSWGRLAVELGGNLRGYRGYNGVNNNGTALGAGKAGVF